MALALILFARVPAATALLGVPGALRENRSGEERGEGEFLGSRSFNVAFSDGCAALPRFLLLLLLFSIRSGSFQKKQSGRCAQAGVTSVV